jgi:tRNA(adenine34) deaminase
MFSDQDRSFMEMALDEAQLSFNDNEVPVGAIIVKDNEVIGSGHNQVINTNNVTSHAEINAIIDASKNINNYRLNNTKMYVTLEPCHMCAKAIIDARIDEVIFAAPEPKTGSIISIDNIYERIKFNHKTSYKHGLLMNESSNLLKKFFKTKR